PVQDHLARAAFFAISDRFFFDSFAARAFPPFNPPSLPSATAAASFGDSPAHARRNLAASTASTGTAKTDLPAGTGAGLGGTSPPAIRASSHPASASSAILRSSGSVRANVWQPGHSGNAASQYLPSRVTFAA